MNPLDFATALARDAGTRLLELSERPRSVQRKSHRNDLVTDADHASEELIVAAIRQAYPASSILVEESGIHRGTSDERWIVDPLDGTTNYAHGYPMYCVSIAYERAGELIAGVVYVPALDECFAAELGSGATLNGSPIAVSGVTAVADALVCTGFVPGKWERNMHAFTRLMHQSQALRRDGAAALDLAFVAAGRFEAFWEFDLKPWDIAAGTLLVREAGGSVSAIDGTPLDLTDGSTLATNGTVHAEMLRLLSAPSE
jgi:myo-inositol-1(or 4)-monophosphatase